MNFTAAQIAAALGNTPRAVRKQLAAVTPAGVRVVAGNEAAAWAVEQLPAALRERLAAAALQQRCKGVTDAERIETLLTMPRAQWHPPVPLDKVAEADIQTATKLREALRPSLVQQHNLDLSAAEFEARGIADYKRKFGNAVTPRYWRELFMRTIRRDNGAEEWNRLELYLADRVKRKEPPAAVVSEALAASFAELESFIVACRNPHAPSPEEVRGIWTLAMQKMTALKMAGESDKSAARKVREFLFVRAPFLALTRSALLKSFQRRAKALASQGGDLKALQDGRKNNGNSVCIPEADIDHLRHSAVTACGGRINAAWRQCYSKLSQYTRERYRDEFQCPAKVYELINRKMVDALHARHHGGKRAVRKLIGGLHGDRWAGIPSMYSWAMDDVTSNIEVAFTWPDGNVSLILPQIIAVMDSASRKIVGYSVSEAKAPTAGLVCAAALDAFRKHNIPKEFWVENGWVFGKSLLVNGKEDDQGRAVVLGLGQFGCSLHHFGKMNPQAKAELERSFETVQRLMERHPGYTGRHQMIDAPDEFKREQRLINSGKVPATEFRYTFVEFVAVLDQMFQEYNATPQHGHLKGLSPNEAHLAMMNPADPPIEYDPKLEWMFANEKQTVIVGVGGVRFTHRSSGQVIRVRGGRLVNLVGQELWAWVHREDPSMVTFMNLDFADPFTMEICQTPSAREHSLSPDSEVLAMEISKIREHERAVDGEYRRLIEQHGNPRRELLNKIRQPITPEVFSTISDGVRRVPLVNGQLAESAAQMQQQREAITAQKTERKQQRNRAQRLSQRTGIVVPSRALENVQAEDAAILAQFLNGKDSQ